MTQDHLTCRGQHQGLRKAILQLRIGVGDGIMSSYNPEMALGINVVPWDDIGITQSHTMPWVDFRNEIKLSYTSGMM